MKSIGVIIGRFQVVDETPELARFFDQIKHQHDETYVIIGVTKIKGSKKNPFSVEIRKTLLKKFFSEGRIVPLDDHPQDETWSAQLDSLVRSWSDGGHVMLYGSEDGFVSRYSGKYPAKCVGNSFRPKGDVEALAKHHAGSTEFRKGVFFGISDSFPKVFPTVDIALFRNHRTEILLGYKSIDQKWRLIGGFSDPSDESFEAAAIRELEEETGVKQSSPLTYEGSFRIDDWRYRHEDDKIISTLFSTEWTSGDAAGGDDIAEVKWFSLKDLRTMLVNDQTAPEHKPLFGALLKKYDLKS
jgi:bifunctional NMN adenylyltransferase/nudix hydrolase